MKQLLISMRDTVGMGLIWAAGWFVVGALIEISEPDPSFIDVWPTALAVPGFVAGVVFFAILRMAEGRRGLREVPLPRFATWGAVTGVLLGVLAVYAGLASSRLPDVWLRAAVIIGPTTLLGAVSAVTSALLFRYAARGRGPAGARAR